MSVQVLSEPSALTPAPAPAARGLTLMLFRKLLRDVRVPFVVVLVLLMAFQCLWAKITERISAQLLPQLLWLGAARNIGGKEIEKTLFEGPGKITRTLMGGEDVSVFRVRDMLTIGYVHPVVLVAFCVWAVGRAAGAIAGELDRGTMELLLAQPLPRSRLILAHFLVDVVTIPLLCLSLWAGNWLGAMLVQPREIPPSKPVQFDVRTMKPLLAEPEGEGELVSPAIFGPGLFNVAALLFAVSGYTLWFSSLGRFRWRVLGVAVFLTLLQFLANAVGQLWDAAAWLRPLTVFYYYQPQQIILADKWTVDWSVWNGGQPLARVPVLAVLFGVGAVGYGLALWTFMRRDLPAPL